MDSANAEAEGESGPRGERAVTTVAACIIARDADADLARCVGSLTGKVDQVVVACDPAKVQRFQRFLGRPSRFRVVPFAWCDDFAAARNAAINAATAKWLFVIDTDEVLDGDLRLLCSLIPDHCDGALMTHMSYADGQGTIGMVVRQVRLLRNGIGAHYEGRIHEQFVLPDRPPVLASQEGVTIFHYGYLPDRTASKRTERLRILRLELEQHPESAFTHYNLGVQFAVGEDYQEALPPFREAIRLWQQAVTDQTPVATAMWIPTLFVSAIFCAVRAGQLDEAIRLAGLAPKEAFTPDYFYYTAMAAWDSGFHQDARDLLERGLVAPVDPHFHEASIPGRIREALAALSAP